MLLRDQRKNKISKAEQCLNAESGLAGELVEIRKAFRGDTVEPDELIADAPGLHLRHSGHAINVPVHPARFCNGLDFHKIGKNSIALKSASGRFAAT
jgi:hypothetical protein